MAGGGSLALIVLLVGTRVLVSGLVIEVRVGLPIRLHTTVRLPLAAILWVGLLRPVEAGLVALQDKHRRRDFDGG